MKGRKWHIKRLAGSATATILLQRNQSFVEMLDQVYSSFRSLCWKVTKYDVDILWLTVSVYERFECPSYNNLHPKYDWI